MTSNQNKEMDSEPEKFSITRIVSRNVFLDIFQQIRNLFGLNLKEYETKVNDTVHEILDEVDNKYQTEWFRVQTDQLSDRAMMITVFGEGYIKNS